MSAFDALTAMSAISLYFASKPPPGGFFVSMEIYKNTYNKKKWVSIAITLLGLCFLSFGETVFK